MGIIAIFLTVSVCVNLSVGQVDLTVVAESRGEFVVEAVVSRIRQSGIFSDDRLLLRRIAYVETNDGNDPKTYRSGYHGGIWQVNETRFQETKNPVLGAKHNQIRQIFAIDWSSVQWIDLRKPLYSGLGARLPLSTIQSPIPLASDISAQAQFWKQYYNTTTGTGTVQTFIKNAITLNENRRGCQSGIDLIFVLDSSGSIGSSNFQLIRDFVSNVIIHSDIGPNKTRVGVVLFSTSASVQFQLNTHLTKPSLLDAVAHIPFTGKGTDTAAGINLSIQLFNTTFGARPRSSGIPRIAIVLTDGRSNIPQETIAAAERSHAANIISYVVGLGKIINVTELNAIASDPKNQYVHLLETFNSSKFRELQETLNNQACTVPAISNVGQNITNTLQPDQVSFLQFTLPTVGMTLHLNVSIGFVLIFGSNKIENPNAAFHDFMISNNNPVVFVTKQTFVRSGSPMVTNTNGTTNLIVYLSIQGQLGISTFVLNTTIGNATTGSRSPPPSPPPPPPSSSISSIAVAVVVISIMLVAVCAITITVTAIGCFRAQKRRLSVV